MTDLLLGICLIAAFAYGYWLMTRLDRFANREDAPKTAFVEMDPDEPVCDGGKPGRAHARLARTGVKFIG